MPIGTIISLVLGLVQALPKILDFIKEMKKHHQEIERAKANVNIVKRHVEKHKATVDFIRAHADAATDKLRGHTTEFLRKESGGTEQHTKTENSVSRGE